MKCPICNEYGYDENYIPRGTGFMPPYQVTVTQKCKNGHKFGKVVEVTVDKWHYALESKMRKDYKLIEENK